MSSYNLFVGIGNITKEIALSYTPNQVPVAEFSIAINKKFGDRESVCFVDCKAWKKTAEFVNKHFKKGDPIMITGELAQDTWQNREGKNQSKHYVNVYKADFLPKAKSEPKPEPKSEPAPEKGFDDDISF